MSEMDFEALADEAERGYDVDPSKGFNCICPRDDMLHITERRGDCPIHGERAEVEHS